MLLAAADDTDPVHHACADLAETTSDSLITSPLVVAEAGYLIDRQLGPDAGAGFFRSIATGETFSSRRSPPATGPASQSSSSYTPTSV